MRSLIPVLALSVIAVTTLAQVIPSWWTSRGVFEPGATPDDFVALNQGQLKNFARAAYDEFEARLPDGAGDELDTLIDSWETTTIATDDYQVVTDQQLKGLCALFFTRIDEVREDLAPGWVRVHPPWLDSTFFPSGPTDPAAVVNIGQAKNLLASLDGNRRLYVNLSNLSSNPADYIFGLDWLKDSTGGGMPDYKKIELDASLLDYDLRLVSGGDQTIIPNAITSAPIVVSLTYQNDPIENVEIVFNGSSEDNGTFCATEDGTWTDALTLTTNADGRVHLFWKAPGRPDQAFTLIAKTAGQTTPLTISASTAPEPPNSFVFESSLASQLSYVNWFKSWVSVYVPPNLVRERRTYWSWAYNFGPGNSGNVAQVDLPIPQLPLPTPNSILWADWQTHPGSFYSAEHFYGAGSRHLLLEGFSPDTSEMTSRDDNWSIGWSRVRLRSARPCTHEYRRHAHIMKRTELSGHETSTEIITLTFTIPKGETVSNIIDLTPVPRAANGSVVDSPEIPGLERQEERIDIGGVYLHFEEYESESGFDGFTRYAESPNLERPILMVPSEGITSTKVNVFHQNLPPSNTLEVEGAAVTASPSEIDLTSNPTTVNLSGTGNTEDAFLTVSDQRVLDLAVLPKEILRIFLWSITLPSRGGPGETVPQNIPSSQQLRDYFNEVYGKQMNVHVVAATIFNMDLNYDVPRNQDDIAVMGVNNMFDFFSSGYMSTEESILTSNAFDSSADINIYFLPTRLQHCSNTSLFDPENGLYGKARALPSGALISYVCADGRLDTEQLCWTVCHEIGHNGGLNHPWLGARKRIGVGEYVEHWAPYDSGFQLKTPNMDKGRLMFGPPGWPHNPETGRTRALLIKPEWTKFRQTLFID